MLGREDQNTPSRALMDSVDVFHASTSPDPRWRLEETACLQLVRLDPLS